MNEARGRIDGNGRVVIPAAFRKALAIKTGDQLVFRLEDNEMQITTLRSRIERAQCWVRRYVKPGVSLVDELIAERRKESRRGRR